MYPDIEQVPAEDTCNPEAILIAVEEEALELSIGSDYTEFIYFRETTFIEVIK